MPTNEILKSRIAPKEVIGVVRRSLCLIDSRLVNHGERVAFIAGRILQNSGRREEVDFESLMLLAFFHDIGAYKTEEIDDMVSFETAEYARHSIYGYLFLKYFTPLGGCAEAVLYHHTSYQKLLKTATDYKIYAQLIHIADRVDMLCMAGLDCVPFLERGRGSLFLPELVDAFLRGNEGGAITSACVTGGYKAFIAETDNRLTLSEAELLGYLEMMVFSIDFRSPHTVTHTITTTKISLLIAEFAGLSLHDRTALSYGALLHDLGKIAIPLSILESTGGLSREEMEIMKTHVVITGRIIGGIVDEEVYNIAVRHHEKLNGTGYPLGLTEKDLTYPEKIIAVADIISALAGLRSYKEPFPKDRILSILRSMETSGQISPEACAVVYRHYDAIMEETEKATRPVIALYEKLSAEYEEIHTQRRI